MGARCYVGNLEYKTEEADLREAFAKFGTVKETRVIKDRDTGKSKGYGFVEMESDDDAAKAIAGLHQTELRGRLINVSEAKARGR